MPTANTTLIEAVRSLSFGMLAVLLAVYGYFHFRDGVANDAAIPVPVYMISHQNMPKAAYGDAASALAMAAPEDGIAMLHRAEALLHAGARGRSVVDEVKRGLYGAPASARGWTLLSEALYPDNKGAAAQALAQALVLAPREYWLVGPQVLDAARLWSVLDPDARRAASAKARLLWSDPRLRWQLRVVVDVPDGAALLTRSLSDDEIRAMNRWLFRERRWDSQP